MSGGNGVVVRGGGGMSGGRGGRVGCRGGGGVPRRRQGGGAGGVVMRAPRRWAGARWGWGDGGLVAAGPEDAAGGGASGEDAGGFGAGAHRALRDAADGDAQALGEFFFLLGGAVPGAEEPVGVAVAAEVGFELVEGVAGADVAVAEGALAFEEVGLDGFEEVGGGGDEVGLGEEGFFAGGLVSPAEADAAFFEVAGADFQTDGDAFFDPFPFFGAAAEVACVDVDADGHAVEGDGAEGGGELLTVGDDGVACVGLGGDGDDDDLLGCDAGRADEAVVIGVGHDEGADHAGGDAPGGGPGVLAFVVAAGKGDVLGFGEVLAEEVGGAGLDGFAVLDHGFDGEGADGAGEAFVFGFFAGDGGDGEDVTLEVFVDFVHGGGFQLGFFAGFVGGVAFLPEEFGGAQEDAGAHFPAHDVAPLVDFEGEVAVGFEPAGEGGADDGFGGGADDVFVCEFAGGDHAGFAGVGVFDGFEAVVGDDGAFGGKAFGVLGFFLQVGDGDEHGEVGVGVAGAFEFGVELLLDEFPDGVAPGFDDHAAADFGVFGEVGGFDDLLVPLGEVLGAGGRDCVLLCHGGVCVCVRLVERGSLCWE